MQTFDSNILLFIALIIFCLVGCKPTPDAEDVDKSLFSQSLVAHDSLGLFDQIGDLSFTKRIVSYDDKLVVRSDITQFHSYQFEPTVGGIIYWSQRGDSTYLQRQDTLYYAFRNGKVDTSASTLKWVEATFSSSMFVLLQPFKLIEADSLYESSFSLEENNYPSISPKYMDSGDEWTFILDPVSHLVVFNLVKHNDRYSLIANESFQVVKGIKLHHKRSSYFVDQWAINRQLNSTYVYDNYSIGLMKDSN
ncbi:MAG: hypothetical protein ACI8QD_002240 [Cyclobacteriaceae bacterium]|jgi:hypothetical protein